MVHNALIHGNPEGHDDHLVELTLQRDGECLELSMTDSGTGMEAAALMKVGDRFHTGQPGQHGSGLGLAIVKQVMESRDGTLQLDNRLEGGLRVILRFPVS